MKRINFSLEKLRKSRSKRIFKKIKLGNEHIRFSIAKTNLHIYLQAIDDNKQHTLAFSSSQQLKLKNGNTINSMKVAEDFLKKLKNTNITRLVLDRGPHKYMGKISKIADFLRNEGIQI